VSRRRVAAARLAAALVALPAASFAANSTADDRISVSADAATLTGTNGGGGGALSWLHNFDADTLATVAVEHQGLGTGQWTFGSLGGALTVGEGDRRYSLYADAHEGAGDDGPRAFHYSIVAAGITGTYFHRLSAQLDDRRIDVETTHGNLPKFVVSYLWNPHLFTTVSYAHSVSGNLGTRLGAARVDVYGPVVNWLAGVAFGQASPVIVLNFQTGASVPAGHLKEGYVGLSKPFPRWRSELLLVADYQSLAAENHATLTLNYVFHIGSAGAGR